MTVTERVQTRGGQGKAAFVTFHEVLKAKDRDFHVFCALSKIPRERIRAIIDARSISKEGNPELTDADINNVAESLKDGVRSLENFLDTTLSMHEKKVKAAYEAAAEQHIDDFAHYFRNLYNIMRFVDDSQQVEEGDKVRYIKFLRSQISEAELVVIFYNSICKMDLPGRESLDLGFPKMSRLLVKYNLLHNINPRSIIHPLHRDIFYKNTPQSKL